MREIAAELDISTATVHKDLHYVEPERSPARGYSWPPFEKGNKVQLLHGTRSLEAEPAFKSRAREFMPDIFDVNPHLDERRDGAAVLRYAVALARIEYVYDWLGERDPVFSDVDKGVAHGIYDRLERWEKQADVAEERLAISPLTRARLGLDLVRARSAADEGLERLQRIGAQIIEAREARDGD